VKEETGETDLELRREFSSEARICGSRCSNGQSLLSEPEVRRGLKTEFWEQKEHEAVFLRQVCIPSLLHQ
jgi:hypothetical protein